jgi:DHA2 family lincomycin resistance protein-like MFS transporter
MVGMSMITTPSQTNGLNQLDRTLYPDGSAIINTMIQTSGTIGTAIAVSILNASQNTFLNHVKDSSNPAIKAEALISGIQDVFIFATIVSIIGLICSFLIKRVTVGRSKAKDNKTHSLKPSIKGR